MSTIIEDDRNELSGDAGVSPALVLVIADDQAVRQRLSRLLRDISRDIPLRVALSTSDEASNEARRLHAELVIIDGRPEDMDAAALWRDLASLDHAPLLICVGLVEDPLATAPDLRIAARMNRPVRREDLAAVLRAAMDEPGSTGPAPARFVSVAERGRVLHVPIEEVVYLKAELKYVTVRTRDREYLTDASLLNLDASFPGVFMRIHRNALVARSAVRGIERAPASGADQEAVRQVVLDGVPERLPVSRRQWSAVKAEIDGRGYSR